MQKKHKVKQICDDGWDRGRLKDFAVILMIGFAPCSVGCSMWQPGTTSIWTHHTEASNFLGLGEIKEPDPKWNQNKGGGVILTWAYWDSFSHRSQRSLIPSVLGTDSFIPYLHCCIFTSGTTSHPGVQSINQWINEQINESINQWIDQWIY